METLKTPLSIKILYWLSNVIMVLFVIICTATILFNILLYTDFFGNDLQLHTQFPVEVSFLETGNLELEKGNIKVELVDATSKIHFFNTPTYLAKRFGLVIIFVMSLGFYLTWLLRKFLKNIKNGIIFEIKNLSILKQMAYGIFGLWLFTIIYSRIFYYYIAKNIVFENIEISEQLSSYPGMLMLAIFIWVLSHIFITGVKLQKEQNLTI